MVLPRRLVDDVVVTYRITVVCTGNICRSPMAEWVLREPFEAAGLGDRLGRRRVYLVGVVWFALASLLCALYISALAFYLAGVATTASPSPWPALSIFHASSGR